ncbi:MAG TPA: glycosyltransferase [Bacteroidota bacterium]|jgi:cellulose synthase/poly-beta-1,6-N-acetylglucosamine synthase-like glycosyltransferase|nr:glycosyltransferase [Bacteroidota bacterium]
MPEHTLLEFDLSIVFLVSVILIWFMIAYQLVLTVVGFFNYRSAAKEKKRVDGMQFEFPGVSILIPAHNEEKVIGHTLEAMVRLEYPDLEIIVINDGSTDATAQIIERYMSQDKRVKMYNVPAGQGGKGKSRALNLGLTQARSEFIAIYDADNTPDPSALRYLMAQMLLDSSLGAVLGKFRTVNKRRNLLTRFINIETLSFQSILQAGRWHMFKIATLPGTNFVVRRALIEKLNGWDEEAITEDSELSIRIYMEGYRIKFIPYSVTYEQEPETWGVWIKQRLRWVRGNNYVAKKFLTEIPKFKNKFLAAELLYLLSLYYVFFVAIVSSDILFLLGLFNVVLITLPGPYTTVWIIAVVLFLFEILLALSYDREDSPSNVFLSLLMYFTYCQFWVYIVGKAIYLDLIKREHRTWVKTVRFDVQAKQ